MWYDIWNYESGVHFIQSVEYTRSQIRHLLGENSLKYFDSVRYIEDGVWYVKFGSAREIWNTMLDLAKE